MEIKYAGYNLPILKIINEAGVSVFFITVAMVTIYPLKIKNYTEVTYIEIIKFSSKVVLNDNCYACNSPKRFNPVYFSCFYMIIINHFIFS